MEVHKIIVHYLIKYEGEQKVNLDLSNGLLDIDTDAINLINRLNASYNKSQITYAVFDEADGNEFPQLFKNYLASIEQNSFLDFTRRSTEILKMKIENISPAKGGFLIFSEYMNDGNQYLSVYLIRDTVGILFKKDKSSSFKINPAEHLDLDKLAMACRINIGKYKGKDGKYISVLKRKMSDISVYFINWIAATDKESNKTFTNNFYQLINLADCPKDEEGEEIPRDLFKKKVYDYINSSPSKIVNINDVSQYFYGDESFLAQFAEKKEIYINTEFQPNSTEMKKFLRINLESDGISIRFSRGELHNNKIRFDDENKNVVIIESERFASDLRREIDAQ